MGQVVDFLADLGEAMERHLSSGGIAVLVVLLAWIHHGLAAIFTTLLVSAAYVRGRYGYERVEREEGNGDFALIVGVILILGGVYWLLKEMFPQIEVNWPVALILLGILMVVLGLKGRSERSEGAGGGRGNGSGEGGDLLE
ncbi:MAG: hypothetical protein QI197_06545 [Candidatus Korarchaeota archaeon]|nr:hypothetical protein [Candidatus Korarchaeota archaeon]